MTDSNKISFQFSFFSDGDEIDAAKIIRALEDHNYLADEELATALFLLLKLHKPILVEGPPGPVSPICQKLSASNLEMRAAGTPS